MSTRCLLVVALALSGCAHYPATPRPKPNFVFLLADDLGWKDLGCYGSTFYETPNIDRLARGGMRFTNAYAACPVCSPTRASIMAGKYPARMHTTDYFGGRRKGRMLPASYIHQLPQKEVTIAEVLKVAGYRTGFFGKWHLGAKPHTPQSQGFDVNFAGFRGGMPPGGYFSPYKNPELTDGPKGEHLTERLTDEALKFIDQSKDQPFLLYFSYYNVHTPLQTKPEYRAKYIAKREKLPEPTGPKWLPEGNRKCRQIQDHAVYAGMVQHLDESVGRVLAKIEQLGLSDNTIIIFMSDNGGLSTSEGHPTSNLPLRAGKGWLYEGGIREPMIVRWPGATKPNSTCDSPIISTDFYPTMLEMAGLPKNADQHMDGRSFVSQLRGSRQSLPRSLFWHYPHYGNQGGTPGSAIRTGDFKLIEFHEPAAPWPSVGGEPRVELYNLASDPGEKVDLSSEMPQKTKELRNDLHTWRHAVDATMPKPNPDWKPRGRRKR
jgi:arylsulfatase A-like enzyme